MFRYRHYTYTYFIDSGLSINYIRDSAWLDDGSPYYFQYDEIHQYFNRENRPIMDSTIRHYVSSTGDDLKRVLQWYKYNRRGQIIEKRILVIPEKNSEKKDTIYLHHKYDKKNRLVAIYKLENKDKQKVKEVVYGKNNRKETETFGNDFKLINYYENSMLVNGYIRAKLSEEGDYQEQITNYSYKKQEGSSGLISIIYEESFGGILQKKLSYEFYE